MSTDLEIQKTSDLISSKDEQTKLYRVLVDHTHIIDCDKECAVYPCSECERSNEEEYSGKCCIECDDYGFVISSYFQDIVSNAKFDEETKTLILTAEDKRRLHNIKPLAMTIVLFGRTMREIAGRGFTLKELSTYVAGGEQIENIKFIPNPAINMIDRLLKLMETLKSSLEKENIQGNDMVDMIMDRWNDIKKSAKG